ncbi:hypothetical protein LWX53_02485 [bacterium]|nr:hypothetical protein [bacterium]
MKKYISVFLILALGGLAFAVPATTELQGLSPKTAKSMGMGGSFRVFSTGYDTFFGNPAGFATPKGSLTIADLATWAYFKPTQTNIEKAQAIVDGTASDSQTASYVGDWIVDNGLGAGASLGLGWAGSGFGLGLTLVTDEIASGQSLLGATLRSQTQANAVAGIAFPISLGPVNFRIGADARAFYRLDSYNIDNGTDQWPFSGIATAMMTPGADPMDTIRDLYLNGGYGFAFDAGATVGIGPLSLGAMVRDYGLEFGMGQAKVGTLIDSMTVPTDGTTPYVMAPTVSAGAALQFNFANVVAPSLYAEIGDVVGVIDGGVETAWNSLHAGAELKLLNFIALRAGLNKGWVSLGAGLDLIIFEVDAALFTEELGAIPGDSGRTGIAVQAAIRL